MMAEVAMALVGGSVPLQPTSPLTPVVIAPRPLMEPYLSGGYAFPRCCRWDTTLAPCRRSAQRRVGFNSLAMLMGVVLSIPQSIWSAARRHRRDGRRTGASPRW